MSETKTIDIVLNNHTDMKLAYRVIPSDPSKIEIDIVNLHDDRITKLPGYGISNSGYTHNIKCTFETLAEWDVDTTQTAIGSDPVILSKIIKTMSTTNPWLERINNIEASGSKPPVPEGPPCRTGF